MGKLYSALWLVLAAVALGGCATNPVTGGQDFVLMSEKQEISLGKQYHKEVMKQYKVYDDPELAALVDKLGQELASTIATAAIWIFSSRCWTARKSMRLLCLAASSISPAESLRI